MMSCDHDLVRYGTMDVCDVCGESELDIALAKIAELEAKLKTIKFLATRASHGDQYDSTCHWAIIDILAALGGE
jgi:hypothetical protein